MQAIKELFERNRKWSEDVSRQNPGFFERLARQQKPKYLWIGCADSRVPPNLVVGLEPGELFVHRNVANLIVHSDLSCLSVMQYAVEVLQVEHVIVCGHYGCGGVSAAMANVELGLIDNWLRNIQDVCDKHAATLERIADDMERCDRLCELNVVEQVVNACRTSVVQDAWRRHQPLAVHGWIYRLTDGQLQDLSMCVARSDELVAAYKKASSAIAVPRHA